MSKQTLKSQLCLGMFTASLCFLKTPVYTWRNHQVSNLNLNSGEMKEKLSAGWDKCSLLQEIRRQMNRTATKISKVSFRNQTGRIESDVATSSLNITYELDCLSNRLNQLNILEQKLVEMENDSGFEEIVSKVALVGIRDNPVVGQSDKKKLKEKRVKQAPRKPYYTYISTDGIEIRVGRASSDNDVLSCDPNYRDNEEWWLHATGAPGSHVIIRNKDDLLPTKFKETLIDAAVLTAANSKLPKSGFVPVTYTRCRYISKPTGAKPGLVRIAGGADVGTLRVNLVYEATRLERLLGTKTQI